MKVKNFLKAGAEIAGAAATPIIATLVGDPTGGALSQLGVVISKELTDYILRPQSKREVARSAGVILLATNEIEKRLKSGEVLRDDDFFRSRTGKIPAAGKLVDGILTKAKLQYEERKIFVLANFFAHVAFNSDISSDDACWYLSIIDALPYRSLIILAAFYELPKEAWNDQNIGLIRDKNKVIFAQINDLRNLGLLSSHSTFSVDVYLSETGRMLVDSLQLLGELDCYGQDVRCAVEPAI